ncbi:MAG TPA: DUF5916 domain-containing protein [Gemmatimonadales bacterium]|nr:DUF5916 domain-containing protein [Gemmatimonadales bacterium]
MRLAIAVVATAVLLPAAAAAQRPALVPNVVTRESAAASVATATALRVTAAMPAPRIDGRLDEAIWRTAPVMSDFVQREPDEGQPASQRTEVRVVYTDDALFVGVTAFDTEPGAIRAQLTRRDDESPGDWISVYVDSYHDRRTAFQFSVNAAGVKRDVYLFNDTERDDSWDAVWDVAVERNAEGWVAEFRIPFSQLRFAPADRHQFGFNVSRHIVRRAEVAMWRMIPRRASGFVSLFGDLDGLEGLQPPRRLQVLPYSVARVSRGPAESGNPFQDGREGSARVGADIKYGLTSNLTLDVTLNPDFGQVEADPAVVNLSAFETFYPERRPFFTEGVNVFSFPILLGDGDQANEQLFYSRRVGRRPQGGADPRGGYAERVDQTTILGAAKLSGRTPSGWTIGLLSAFTQQERAEVRDSVGAVHFDVVEPRTSYFVGRLARDFREGRTLVGLFTTAMHRDLPANLDWMRSSAYTVGLDFNHRFGRDAYRVRGWVVGSNVRGSTAAITATQRSPARYYQRPDNDHTVLDSTRTALSGFASQFSIGKENGTWRWSTGYDTRSPGFEVNDMGYQRTADYFQQYAWVGGRWFPERGLFRRFGINFNQWSAWNYGGERLFTGGNINANWQYRNYWGGWAGINRGLSGMTTSELRGGPALLRPGNINGWGGLYSDSRKRLRFETGGWFFAQDENDSWGGGLFMWIGYRPSGSVDLSVNPSLDLNNDDWQYVTTTTVGGRDEYVFGDLVQRTVGAGFRANFTFSPTLTLQVYAQPFYSAGRYLGYRRVADPRGATYADRMRPIPASQVQVDGAGNVRLDLDADSNFETSLGNPNFGYVSLRSNVVLRWEYRPGSTLFLVWQQGRESFSGEGNFDLSRSWRNLRRSEGENVFLVKLNYWLSL